MIVLGPTGFVFGVPPPVVEPFVGDIADQSEMLPLFPLIENDRSFPVSGVWIQVFVPVGVFHLQKPRVREAMVRTVHDWLRVNRLSIPTGNSKHICNVITLTLKVADIPGEGKLNVRRRQVGDTFGDVIERVLTKKLPKLGWTLLCVDWDGHAQPQFSGWSALRLVEKAVELRSTGQPGAAVPP